MTPIVIVTSSTATSSTNRSIQSAATSKRVNIQGNEAILASDEDSDRSLPDLADIMGRPKRPVVIIPMGQKRTSSGNTKISQPPPPPNGLSIEEIHKKKRAAEEAKARIEDMERKLTDEAAPSMLSPDAAINLAASEGIIAACLDIEDKEEKEIKLQRTMDAVKRIEALKHDTVWHFFHDTIPEAQQNRFPRKCLPQEAWAAPLTG
jgi:hypothetical protein